MRRDVGSVERNVRSGRCARTGDAQRVSERVPSFVYRYRANVRASDRNDAKRVEEGDIFRRNLKDAHKARGDTACETDLPCASLVVQQAH